MKTCAYCGKENEEAAVACRECGTVFAPTPVSMTDPQSEDPALALVIVGAFRNVVEADVVKTRLEAAGIEACIPEEYTPQILWYAVPSPLESVTVRVAAKDYEAARQLLAEEG